MVHLHCLVHDPRKHHLLLWIIHVQTIMPFSFIQIFYCFRQWYLYCRCKPTVTIHSVPEVGSHTTERGFCLHLLSTVWSCCQTWTKEDACSSRPPALSSCSRLAGNERWTSLTLKLDEFKTHFWYWPDGSHMVGCAGQIGWNFSSKLLPGEWSVNYGHSISI